MFFQLRRFGLNTIFLRTTFLGGALALFSGLAATQELPEAPEELPYEAQTQPGTETREAAPDPVTEMTKRVEELKLLKPSSTPAVTSDDSNASPLSAQVEDLKQAALELNRDLLILEEDLLFPASTQMAVYVSVDVGNYFKLDAVKLKVDDKLVASHVYSDKQNSALERGGIQRLYVGNLKTGTHEITAFFHGYGPQNREYKRAATYTLRKDQNPKMLELRIMDSTVSMQPEFDFKEWQL